MRAARAALAETARRHPELLTSPAQIKAELLVATLEKGDRMVRPKSKYPEKVKSLILGIRLDEELSQAIDRAAREMAPRGIELSRSDAARALIKLGLEQHKKTHR